MYALKSCLNLLQQYFRQFFLVCELCGVDEIMIFGRMDGFKGTIIMYNFITIHYYVLQCIISMSHVHVIMMHNIISSNYQRLLCCIDLHVLQVYVSVYAIITR